MIALPDDILDDISDKQQRTRYIGMIARILAIFKIDEVIFYNSPFIAQNRRSRDQKMLRMVLEYLETPQYLRKKLFPIHHNLNFVGLCPPLATPHHQTRKTLSSGEIREGLLFLYGGGIMADVGSRNPVKIQNPPRRSFADGYKVRAPIKINSVENQWVGTVLEPDEAQKIQYMGYKVRITNSSLPKYLKNRNKFIILTSKLGKPLEEINFEKNIQSRKNEPLLIVFGSANHGILEYLKAEEKSFSDVADLTINTMKNAGTRTLRLEEAMMISLSRILPSFSI
jgi:predicted SPOUT superfamily RNA methylase MTH1